MASRAESNPNTPALIHRRPVLTQTLPPLNDSSRPASYRAGMKTDRTPTVRAVPLSAESAFVVHLTATAMDSPDIVEGRIEHISSGRCVRFASLAELIGFMQQTLLQGA